MVGTLVEPFPAKQKERSGFNLLRGGLRAEGGGKARLEKIHGAHREIYRLAQKSQCSGAHFVHSDFDFQEEFDETWQKSPNIGETWRRFQRFCRVSQSPSFAKCGPLRRFTPRYANLREVPPSFTNFEDYAKRRFRTLKNTCFAPHSPQKKTCFVKTIPKHNLRQVSPVGLEWV